MLRSHFGLHKPLNMGRFGDANPMTNEELIEKFKDCASHSVKPIKKQNIDKAGEFILNIDTADDIRDVISLIS